MLLSVKCETVCGSQMLLSGWWHKVGARVFKFGFAPEDFKTVHPMRMAATWSLLIPGQRRMHSRACGSERSAGWRGTLRCYFMKKRTRTLRM